MATGTGKARTVLGLIYRFLETKRFRRILFLVDRTALGEQAQDVFKKVKLAELITLDEIYNIKSLNDKAIDREARVQIATVQGMVKRLLYNDGEAPCPPYNGDTVTILDPVMGEITNSELLADELDFEIENFSRKVVNENFNRAALEEIA